mmetsp:Transcript_92934/g.200971  ORF Transcript_92934/g.200971 Transcript_92934/m.200971 type:complete len:385 (+) Transcript_92934:44-1198(+)
MGFGKPLGFLAALVVAFVAACLGKYNFVLKRWQTISKLDKNAFDAVSDLNVHTDIQITYYEPGKMGDILKEWPHGEFRLFRVKPGHDFKFDGTKIRSPVVGKKLNPSCLEDPSVHQCFKKSSFVTGCLFDYNNSVTEEVMMEAGSILTGEGKGYRAAFANLTNKETINMVWDSLNLPFSITSTWFEHSFISNLDQDSITAPFHANGLTDSMAYQVMGKKTWVFLPPPTWVDLMQGTAAAAALFVKRSPPAGSKPEAYVVTTEPGDVLFFPNCWGHSVYTYAGPNLLLNFRKVVPSNFLRHPEIYFSVIFEHFVTKSHDLNVANTNQKVDDEVKQLSRIVPTKKENLRVDAMYSELCVEQDGLGFDRQILGIMDTEVARVKAQGK